MKSVVSFVLKGQKNPFPAVELSKQNAVRANMRLRVLGSQDAIVHFVIDEIRLYSTIVRGVKGKELRERILCP